MKIKNIRYFFFPLIISLLAISCSSSSGDTCKGKIFIYPDSINVNDIRIKGVHVQNIYDHHNQCLIYYTEEYMIFHFIESCNTYFDKWTFHPELLKDGQGITLYSSDKSISSMSKNRDLEDCADVERLLQSLLVFHKYFRIDTIGNCLNDIFQIEYLPQDTSRVAYEKHIISDCAIYQAKLMEIYNELSKDALAIFLWTSSMDDLEFSGDIFFLRGPEDNMQLLKLNFVKKCYGTYIYQPDVDMYL